MVNLVDERIERAASDLQEALRALPVPEPPQSRLEPPHRLRLGSLGTVAAAFVVVLLIGLPALLLNPGGETRAPASQDSVGPSVAVSGLGIDGTYFTLDDPTWTVMEAWAVAEGDRSTNSSYERGEATVRIMTGSIASEILAQTSDYPETALTINSTDVTERSSSEGISFIWTTSDGLPVIVIFGQMNREQALEVSTALRPIDFDGWEQLSARAALISPTMGESDPARTGRFGTGGEDGTGEWIRLDVSEARGMILEMADGIDLPPDHTFDRLIENLPDEPTEMTEGGIMNMLEFEAGCIWTGYWLESVASGDTESQERAQTVLDEIPTWPALNASDGGGVIDAWARNAELAAQGDVQGVLDNLYTNNCTDVVPGE
jgi:hypothetical protein